MKRASARETPPRAATEEVFGADGDERPRHLERDIDGILADFSRRRIDAWE